MTLVIFHHTVSRPGWTCGISRRHSIAMELQLHRTFACRASFEQLRISWGRYPCVIWQTSLLRSRQLNHHIFNGSQLKNTHSSKSQHHPDMFDICHFLFLRYWPGANVHHKCTALFISSVSIPLSICAYMKASGLHGKDTREQTSASRKKAQWFNVLLLFFLQLLCLFVDLFVVILVSSRKW